jgi:hypothetical protein
MILYPAVIFSCMEAFCVFYNSLENKKFNSHELFFLLSADGFIQPATDS